MIQSVPCNIARRRRHRKRSSRSAVLWGLATIVILHLGMLGIYAVRWVNDPMYLHQSSLLKRLIARTPEKQDIVVAFGTSRIGQGFDAKRVNPVVQESLQRPCAALNFGFPGIGPMAELIYLRRLLADGMRPDLVIIETYVWTLTDQNGCPIEKGSISAERLSGRESLLLRHYGYPREEVKRKRLEIVEDPWGELRLPIMARLWPSTFPHNLVWNQISRTDECGFQGFLDRDLTPERRRRAMDIMLRNNAHLLGHWQPSNAELAALREVIGSCRANHIEVLLIAMPEGPKFRSLYSPATEAQFEKTIGQISADCGVKWVNARQWFDDEEYFFDSHHLYRASAAEFTDRLTKEYIVPMLAARNDRVKVAERKWHGEASPRHFHFPTLFELP